MKTGAPRSGGRRWTPICLTTALVLSTTACVDSRPDQSRADKAPITSALALGHFPDAPTKPFPDSMAAALQSVLDKAVKVDGLPGVTATVLAAGRGAWSGAAGSADGTNAVEPRSQFAIASITKTVIAAEIMRLAEQGLLRLSDPISDHLPPSFRFDTNGATVENVLAMESGIPDPRTLGDCR